MSAKTDTSAAHRTITALLDKAGIRIGGPDPWDIQVHDPRLYRRIATRGSIGLGESYVDGLWDAESLDGFFTRLFDAGIGSYRSMPWPHRLRLAWFRVFNLQGGKRSHEIGKRHYDTGNELFRRMLDRRMTYSCGYWKGTGDLDAAQEAKLDLICHKMRLREGMHLLDIGSGWGSLLQYAAETYGVRATGITVSAEQADYSRRLCKSLPVEVRLQDYRTLTGMFDAISSIGMAEHVGWKNYGIYMQTAHRCLEDGGIFALHTIGSKRSVRQTDPWIEKYIFPNSMLPSLAQLTRAAEPYFVVEDVQNLGPDYDRTLMAWDRNFRAAWPELNASYDERFYRMWRYFLMASAASFRSRRIQLWQLVLAKKPGRTRYDAPR